MGISKKVKKLIGIGVVLLIAAPVLTHNPVYYRLYPGNRIKADIKVLVDGEVYKIDESNIQFTGFEDHNGKVSAGFGDVTKVRYRANEYDRYTFDIVGTPINQPISIGFCKNCWNICEADIVIDIDTAAETLTFRSDYTEIEDNEIFRHNTKRNETIYYNKTDDKNTGNDGQNKCSFGYGM